MSTSRIPKGVGYWGPAKLDGSTFQRLPRPQALVRPDWFGDDLAKIVDYLKNGRQIGAWPGLAHCRFEGCGQVLGSTDLTDGEWIWPSGLEHYLLEHSVRLPDEFIHRMAACDWRVPPEGPEGAPILESDDYCLPLGDLIPWITWAEAAYDGQEVQVAAE